MPLTGVRQELVGPALELVQGRERRGESLHAIAFHVFQSKTQAELFERRGQLGEGVVEIEVEWIVGVVGLLGV